MIFAVGFTAGGAPCGLTREEFERAQSRPVEASVDEYSISVDWADAKDALHLLLDREGERLNRDTVGFIRFVGDGVFNRVFGTSIRRAGRPEEWVVVKLPSEIALPDRRECLHREAAVLRYLEGRLLPFKVPRIIGEIESPVGLALVQEWLDGMRIDLRSPHSFGEPTSNLVAEVAAAIHSVDPVPLRGLIPTYATRRDHALACAASLEELAEPEAKDTYKWIVENLPAAEAPSLLHGDLLGQNLMLGAENGIGVTGEIGVIDWGEARIGDPAYELAIVTRCGKKVFGDGKGRERLVDAYNQLGRTPITVSDVHLHELVLVANWYRDACDHYGIGSPHAENQLARWRSVLKRATHR